MMSISNSRLALRRSKFALTALIAATIHVALVSPGFAIDGPGVTAIPNNQWGTATDIWPHVVRLEIDMDGDGDFFDEIDTDGDGTLEGTWCTGTLIAPDVIVTAGHCFDPTHFVGLGPNRTIPTQRVRVNFGPGQGANQYILNNGGRVDQFVAQAPNDFAFLTLRSAAPVSPIAVLPREPRVGDINFAVGYGVDTANTPVNNAASANRKLTVVNNYAQHNEASKNWSVITVDQVPVGGTFVEQLMERPEKWTETGDSGGPGIQRHSNFPPHAFGSNISGLAWGDFVMSAVSGGETPITNNSAVANNIDYIPSTAAVDAGPNPNPDQWSRLDVERNFFNATTANLGPASMRPLPGSYQIFHNLPDDPSLLNPNDVVKVLWKASFNSTGNYLMNLKLWEEDTELGAGPYSFSGDVNLDNTFGFDDLAGYGHSAGTLTGLQTTVYAWDETLAGNLFQFDELGNPLDPPLDWVFQLNYADDLQRVLVAPLTLAQVNAQIAVAQAAITAGTAVRGGFALVQIPEPATLALLAVGGLALVSLGRRPRTLPSR